MPKQPLRTNQIVSKLKAASSPVVYGTATNAIDALQLSLDSPTPIGAWVCQTSEGEKSLSVIDLGSSAYLGLDIDPKLGYINCYLASGTIIGKGDKGNQIKGPLFHFLSREDVNDTATQLINAGESKEIVNPNPSAEATATLEKLQVGETVYGINGLNVYRKALDETQFNNIYNAATNWRQWSIGSILDSTEAAAVFNGDYDAIELYYSTYTYRLTLVSSTNTKIFTGVWGPLDPDSGVLLPPYNCHLVCNELGGAFFGVPQGGLIVKDKTITKADLEPVPSLTNTYALASTWIGSFYLGGNMSGMPAYVDITLGGDILRGYCVGSSYVYMNLIEPDSGTTQHEPLFYMMAGFTPVGPDGEATMKVDGGFLGTTGYVDVIPLVYAETISEIIVRCYYLPMKYTV